MIILTGRDTGLPAYVYINGIQKIERIKEGPRSFTRIYLAEPKDHFEYFLDVKEKEDAIKQKIAEEKEHPREKPKVIFEE